jgi:protein O-GlcNAc transferase
MSIDTDWEATLDVVLADYEAGRLSEAEAACNQFLKRWPDYPGALHYLGLIRFDLGDTEAALTLIQRAVNLEPDYAEAHFDLGNVLFSQAKLGEAVASYACAIAYQPEFAEARVNLGRAHLVLGKLDEAAAQCLQAIALASDLPEAHYNFAQVLHIQGRLEESATAYVRSVELGISTADIHSQLGNVLLALGRFEQAMTSYRQSISIEPDRAEVHCSLGVALKQLGRLEEAQSSYQRAIALRADFAEAYNNLGNVYLVQGKLLQAEVGYRHAITLQPEFVDAQINLAQVLYRQGKLAEAEVYFRRVIALVPDSAQAHFNLGLTLQNQGQLMEAEASYRKALSLRSDWPEGYSNLLLAMQYRQELNNQDWQEALVAFGQSCRKISWFTHHSAGAERRLRIGYLSPDFRAHSCAWFFEPLLAKHNREQFEVFCYANVPRPDLVSARLQALAEHWHSIVGLDNAALAQLIQDHQIDILVDLAGHTSGNRLPAFAHKLAPIQCSWLGFPGSTGLETIDYRLSDAWLTPADTTEYFSETLWNLPLAHCYRPLAEAPDIRSLPALRQGWVTFGSFNNLSKVNSKTITLWAGVLRAVPNSRLLLKDVLADDAGMQQRLQNEFAAQGILPERLIFLGQVLDFAQHLDCYNSVDIGLDTFPYNGATTTVEALWMGVPVISLVGQRTASRYGLSFLNAVGLEAFAVTSPEAYIQTARDLAMDRQSLAHLRQELRQQVAGSPLCDEMGFAHSIERSYQQMWQHWRNQQIETLP